MPAAVGAAVPEPTAIMVPVGAETSGLVPPLEGEPDGDCIDCSGAVEVMVEPDGASTLPDPRGVAGAF